MIGRDLKGAVPERVEARLQKITAVLRYIDRRAHAVLQGDAAELLQWLFANQDPSP